ncbi:Nitroreductase [Reticulomyxa filosa]|uniref:Nitroreductase n=1 Tax=Reticulomyxa filosa TaxID=46433 RepID=X6NPL6_RETFI|nr:Nitroreductase [Reticulomyxa filosa]|eukprot:ETO27941.1 Nitroreductase [Reticulomyxa filosa]
MISQAVASRNSTRHFLPRKVPQSLILEILDKAKCAPSGGNLQPWNVYIVIDETRDMLVKYIEEYLSKGKLPTGSEYHIYPPTIKKMPVYEKRREDCNNKMYGLLGIARNDRMAKLQHVNKNWTFFGAPLGDCFLLFHMHMQYNVYLFVTLKLVCNWTAILGLIFTIDKQMQVGQFADLGIFMQTIMLLCHEYGLNTCSQESWALFSGVLKQLLNIPDNELVFCGMSIGYADPDKPVNSLKTDRASLKEFVFIPTAQQIQQNITKMKSTPSKL